MNPLQKLNELVVDTNLLAKSSNNHERRKYIRDNFMNYELINYLITECQYSANYIAKFIFKPIGYNTGSGEIIKMCKEYGINVGGIKESANLESVRNMYKDTCRKKYGADNVLSKGTSIFKKRNKTVKTKYGVTNVFQLKSVIEKSKESLMTKYGVTSPIYLPTYERNYGKRSNVHIKIEEILKKNNIKFQSEVANKFYAYNKWLKREYSPIVDILIEDKKIVIEINGDIWHANPKIYKDSDMIRKWGGLISAKEIRAFDKARIKQIKSFGYDVVVLWCSDIRTNIKKINKILNEKVF